MSITEQIEYLKNIKPSDSPVDISPLGVKRSFKPKRKSVLHKTYSREFASKTSLTSKSFNDQTLYEVGNETRGILRITITDTGCGIDQQKQQNMF